MLHLSSTFAPISAELDHTHLKFVFCYVFSCSYGVRIRSCQVFSENFQHFWPLVNHILDIYLRFPLSRKISRIEAESRSHGVLKFKLEHMLHTKKGLRPKNSLGPGQGDSKVCPTDNSSTSKFGFFNLNRNFNQVLAIFAKSMLSRSKWKEDLRLFTQKISKLKHFLFLPA